MNGKRAALSLQFACWLALRRLDVAVVEHAQGGAVEVLVLAGVERPQEHHQPQQAEQQGQRDQVDEHRHAGTVRPLGTAVERDAVPRGRARSALAVTVIEEPDMASAAISGVTRPKIARGTAKRL